jgi:hypothetical protein
MKDEDTPKVPKGFFRKAWSWLLMPVVAYLIAIPVLGGGALFLPIVIIQAPLGIIGCFKKITVSSGQEWAGPIFLIHLVFWVLFAIGFGGRLSFSRGLLKAIWIILAVALVMSIAGCGAQLGHGLRSDGNWH